MFITHVRAEDWPDLIALYRAAFPAEDLIPLQERLQNEVEGLLSLVARDAEGRPIGHILFTPCAVEGVPVDLLAPLAVHPVHQGRGIGQALIRAGLAALADTASTLVLVLGDPNYYSRSGFRPTDAITPPYSLPEAWAGAWQARALKPAGKALSGPLIVPAPWQQQALWTDG